MRRRNVFASSLMAALLAAGFLGVPPMVDGASAGKSAQKSRSYVLEGKRSGKRRARTLRIPLPVGPSYVYQDYPYYYRRGHYPTHIGGYVYYPPTYYSRGYDYRASGPSRRHKARRD